MRKPKQYEIPIYNRMFLIASIREDESYDEMAKSIAKVTGEPSMYQAVLEDQSFFEGCHMMVVELAAGNSMLLIKEEYESLHGKIAHEGLHVVQCVMKACGLEHYNGDKSMPNEHIAYLLGFVVGIIHKYLQDPKLK